MRWTSVWQWISFIQSAIQWEIKYKQHYHVFVRSTLRYHATLGIPLLLYGFVGSFLLLVLILFGTRPYAVSLDNYCCASANLEIWLIEDSVFRFRIIYYSCIQPNRMDQTIFICWMNISIIEWGLISIQRWYLSQASQAALV